MLSKIVELFDKARSNVYAIFLFWLFVLLLPVIFTSLFVDQNLIYTKTGYLKNEYIRHEYFNFASLWSWMYVLAVVVAPFVLTRLTVWDFPRIFVNRSYKQELENLFIKEDMLLDKQEELERKRNKIAVKKADTAEKELQAAEQIKEAEEKEGDRWQNDYQSFKRTNHYDNFHLIPESIYEHYGRTQVEGYNDEIIFEIPTSLLSYIDGLGLVDVDVRDKRITLTPKGKYFMLHYQNDKSITVHR